MVSVQRSALITRRETRTVYKLGYWKRNQVGIRQKQQRICRIWTCSRQGRYERSQRTASSGYSRAGRPWNKCNSVSKRCKLSRLWTLGPSGSPYSQPAAFQITETKEGGMMVITTRWVTQMHDIVKSLQDRPESAKEILWNEGLWLGEELGKARENYYEVLGYSLFATCGNDQCRSKNFCVLTSTALPSTSPWIQLHAPCIPSILGSLDEVAVQRLFWLMLLLLLRKK